MRPSALFAAVLACTVCTAVAGPVSVPGYNCPSSCVLPNCYCAQDSAPGGMNPSTIPQFILFTHDDAITSDTNALIRQIIDKHQNPNGCNTPATFFTLEYGTDCNLAKAFYLENNEIALHTVHHLAPSWPFPGGIANLTNEMLSVRTWLNETCGIPYEAMKGFRSPYLVANPTERSILQKNGILYDSTLIEAWGASNPTSPNASAKLWPYTMDYGIPQNCANFGNNCSTSESEPGLWEVPMWEIQSSTGADLYSMDPGSVGVGDGVTGVGSPITGAVNLTDLLLTNFNNSYYGNRAPFGIFIHTPWLTNETINATNAFLSYALSQPDVWMVTISDMLRWMQNPVAANQMNNWLTCTPVDFATAPGEAQCQRYVATSGDDFFSIAGKFGVQLTDLEAVNPKINPGYLAAGMVLNIPPYPSSCGNGTIVTGPGMGIAPASATAARSSAAMAPSAAAPAPAAAPTAGALLTSGVTVSLKPNSTAVQTASTSGATTPSIPGMMLATVALAAALAAGL